MLPLGGNAIRRSLGAKAHKIISKALRDSISMPSNTANRRWNTPCSLRATWTRRWPASFVSMYVNERTLDYGPDGREAIRKLLEMGHERGIIPIAPQVDFVD